MLDAKNKGYLLPVVVDPADSDCVPVQVPRDQNHQIAFWGALQTLANWWSWEGDAAKQGTDAAAVWVGVITAAHAAMGSCDSMPPEFRITNCDLEWRADPADSWIVLGNVCGDMGIQGIQGVQGIAGSTGATGADGADGATGADGADGVDGLQGIQGVQGIQGATGADGSQGTQGIAGADGADGENAPAIFHPPTSPTTAELNQNICAGVNGLLISFVIARYNDSMVEWDLHLTGAKIIGDAIIGIIELFSGGTAEALPVDEAFAFVTDLISLDVANIIADINNSQNQEDWKTALYCRIVNSSQKDITAQIWSDFLEFDVGVGLVLDHGLKDWAEKYEFETIHSRYNVNALDVLTSCTNYDCGLPPIPPIQPTIFPQFFATATGVRYDIDLGNRVSFPFPEAFGGTLHGFWDEIARRQQFEFDVAANGFTFTYAGIVIDFGQPVTFTSILLDQMVEGNVLDWGGAKSNMYTSEGIDQSSEWIWQTWKNTAGSGSEGFTVHSPTPVPNTRFVYVSMRNLWIGEGRGADLFFWNNITLSISVPCLVTQGDWFTTFCL